MASKIIPITLIKLVEASWPVCGKTFTFVASAFCAFWVDGYWLSFLAGVAGAFGFSAGCVGVLGVTGVAGTSLLT